MLRYSVCFSIPFVQCTACVLARVPAVAACACKLHVCLAPVAPNSQYALSRLHTHTSTATATTTSGLIRQLVAPRCVVAAHAAGSAAGSDADMVIEFTSSGSVKRALEGLERRAAEAAQTALLTRSVYARPFRARAYPLPAGYVPELDAADSRIDSAAAGMARLRVSDAWDDDDGNTTSSTTAAAASSATTTAATEERHSRWGNSALRGRLIGSSSSSSNSGSKTGLTLAEERAAREAAERAQEEARAEGTYTLQHEHYY
jgi:hypothetical protein